MRARGFGLRHGERFRDAAQCGAMFVGVPVLVELLRRADVRVSEDQLHVASLHTQRLEERRGGVARVVHGDAWKALSFRKHSVRDETITARSLGGTIQNHPLVEVISARTMRERAQPIPSKEELGRPLLVLEELGAAGLAQWAENYDTWERFILPSVTITGQRHRFAEDIVTSTSMSLEAAGQLLGERPGEEVTHWRGRPSTATYVYRCLNVLNVGWGEYIHSQLGLARAIANSYNSIKHANRGAFPDQAETLLISEVSELLVRLLAVRLTGQGADLLQRYSEGSELWKLKQMFDAYRIRIADDNGSWAETNAAPSDGSV